ncbi:MATE family efflux transporter [Fusobacterium ulcerans]|uniref:MATE family efflux transporter n=1 Tax=Fusobacterium ulcerans TaxID=861 RepID=UPI0034AA90D6
MKSKIITNKMYLSLMFPFIFSTITQPLLGAVDIAVIGRLANENYISGIAIGALIFNTLYWMFGFLRVSSTGYSAQSTYKTLKENSDIFLRPVFMAVCISIIFLIFQKTIFNTSMKFIAPMEEIQNVSYIYFKILINGAPFVLFNYVVLGWLMGKGDIKGSLVMQIGGNILNIVLDIIFVLIMNYGVEGVAYATLISQVFSTVLGLYFIIPYGYFKHIDIRSILNKNEFMNIISLNKNLMVRTFFLLMHNNMIMAASSGLGADILAANSILLQILSLISYAFDGIANTSSVFAGRARGLKDNNMMKDVWKKNLQWGMFFVFLLTIIYISGSKNVILTFTNIEKIVRLSEKYSYWIALYPITAFLGLTYYGIFTGSNMTLPVAQSTFLAFLIFTVSWKFIIPEFENNGVWASLIIFYFCRGIFLIPQLKKTLV